MREIGYETSECVAWRLVHEHGMGHQHVMKRLGLSCTGELFDMLAAETARRRAAEFQRAKTADEGPQIQGGWRGMSGLEKSDLTTKYLKGWAMRQSGYSPDAIAERCSISYEDVAHLSVRIKRRAGCVSALQAEGA